MFYNNYEGIEPDMVVYPDNSSFWIFATPYNIPGQRNRNDSPLDILQKRYSSWTITTDEYQEKKSILENNLNKHLN